jgi:hypothetical protein
MSHVIYRKNDNTIQWTWLADASDGEYVNNATVTFSLYSGYSLNPGSGALTTPGGSVNLLWYGPVTMTYQAGSNGKYEGRLAASINLNIDLQYTIEINATANGRTARRSIPVTVVDRVT